MASLTATCRTLLEVVTGFKEETVVLAPVILGKTIGVTKEVVVLVTMQIGVILSDPDWIMSLELSAVVARLKVTCFSDLCGLFFVVSIETGKVGSFREFDVVTTTEVSSFEEVLSPPTRIISLFFLITSRGFSSKTVTTGTISFTSFLSASYSLAILSVSLVAVEIVFTDGGFGTDV